MTRTFFLLLVVANVVAFIWFGWLRSPAQSQPATTPLPQVQPLRLVSELTPTQRNALVKPAPGPQPAPAATSNAVASCASYGPFPDVEAAQAGAARLQKDGATVNQRTVAGKVRLGYWVYLPPFSSHREAESAAALLKKRGVKDLYIVTTAANRDAISLGVYSDRYGAQAHQKAIRQLGFHALVTERFRDAPRYWLDAHGAGSSLPAASVFADLGEGDIVVGQAACAAGSGA